MDHRSSTSAPAWLRDPPVERVRVMAVQFPQQALADREAFDRDIAEYLRVAGDYACDFICFPEFMALQLLSLSTEVLPPAAAVAALSAEIPRLDALFSDLAQRHRVHIIGGAFPQQCADGKVRNLAKVYLRDGRVETRAKVHATPSEAAVWGVVGGTREDMAPIDTDVGPIGVLICYDSEFPEQGRILIDAGALILFVPFCTDDRHGYLRVRHATAARCVENQCYAVLAGNVGRLPRVANMDIQYAQSCILTPCDVMFARDGIAAEADPGVGMVLFADLELKALLHARRAGTVRNLRDRRLDLY